MKVSLHRVLLFILALAVLTLPQATLATQGDKPDSATADKTIAPEFLETLDTKGKPAKPCDNTANTEIPEWVRRTNVALSGGSHEKLKYFFETIQPLFGTQYKDLIFFNQSRLSVKEDRPIYNTGFGLRKIFNKKYLLGVNSFYDYQDLHKHSRGGVGLEVITSRGLEGRVNSYIAISRDRLVGQDSVNFYYEKVANGLDWEVGLPLPYLPYLKVYGGGNWYNFDHFKNKYGWKFRTEFSPIKYSRLNFELFDNTKTKNPQYRIEGALTLAFTSFCPKEILDDIKCKKEAYPEADLNDRVLERVVRDFDITLIKTIKSAGGLTVEGGRT